MNSIRDNIARWIARVGSKPIILAGFAIVILLGMLPILYTEWAVGRSTRTMNRFVDVDEKIAELSLTSTTKMVKTRRNEKDFLLSSRSFGFNEAKGRYITTVLSIIAEIKENMSHIRLLTDDPELIRLSQEIDSAISRYEEGLLAFVEFQGLLGNENRGLEGKIRRAAHELEKLIGQGGNNQLLVDLLSMRMSEKDYFLDELDMSFAKIHTGTERFKDDIRITAGSPEHKKQLLQQLDTYMALFGEYGRIVEQQETTRQRYLKSLQNVEPMLEKLHLISVGNVHKANNGLKLLERQIRTTLFVIFFLVFFLSSAMAFFVLRRIKEAEERLTVSERKYRVLFETSPDAITIMDLNHAILMVNQRTLSLLGYDHPRKMVGKSDMDLIIPEDRPVVDRLLTGLSETVASEAVEFRMVRNDGTTVTVEGAASCVHDAQGKPESIIVVARDITARKLAEEEARTALKYARYIINSSLDMIITVDTNRKIVEFNKAAEEIFGYQKDEVIGKHIEMLYRDGDEDLKVRRSILETGRFVGEVINKTKNNELFPCFLCASIVKDAEGKMTGFMGVSRDITERKKIEEELIEAATLDKLTGIYNRSKFESILNAEIDRAKRYKNPLSLIMIDVDHFKRVNDTHGHLIGDDVLQTLAVVVQDNIRKTDYFGRWGGEEFMILTPETTWGEALELAEKIRNLIERHMFGKVGRVTISGGITQLREHDSLDSLVKRADDSLYQAKNEGRNRMVVEG